MKEKFYWKQFENIKRNHKKQFVKNYLYFKVIDVIII